MHFDDPVRHGEAQTGSFGLPRAPGRLGLLKFEEDPLVVFRGDAWPCVAHLHADRAILGYCPDLNSSPLRGEFYGVPHQVQQTT